MTLWTRLKQRKLVQWGLAYLAGTHLFRCGAALEFDLADAPNFSARLREAGVDPASFRRMPRLSEQGRT